MMAWTPWRQLRIAIMLLHKEEHSCSGRLVQIAGRRAASVPVHQLQPCPSPVPDARQGFF